jgi:hydrogenase maturation factor HypE
MFTVCGEPSVKQMLAELEFQYICISICALFYISAYERSEMVGRTSGKM